MRSCIDINYIPTGVPKVKRLLDSELEKVTPPSTLYFGFQWSLAEHPVYLPHDRERGGNGSPSRIYMSAKRRICSDSE